MQSLTISRSSRHMHRAGQLTCKPIAMLVAGFIAVISSGSHAADANLNANGQNFARGRILVEARAGLANSDLEKILKVHGGKHRKIGQSNVHIVDLPFGKSEVDVVEKLARHPLLRFAELDRRVGVSAAVNDPYSGSEWHLGKIEAPGAWDTTHGTGVVVAILDSGVDSNHPDLAPNLVAGYNIYDSNTNTADVCGHGTAVAGVVAAASNNGMGVAGVAGQAKIMPVRIAYLDTASNSCYAYYSTVASGITYAADHGARVANVSYAGVAGSAAIQSAGDYLKGKGGLLFVAAGNAGVDENFSQSTSMIAVSATDSGDVKAAFSSFGNFVSLSAPGVGIWTTSRGGAYQAWNGTSFASPVAAGVAALMMATRPAMDGGQVEKLLFSSATDIGAAGRDPFFGYGRVNAAAAVRAVASVVTSADMQSPTASILAPFANSSVSGLVAVNVDARDNVGVTRVDLKANGTVVATSTTTPFSFSWDSKGVGNGMASLAVSAYDAAGNAGNSASVTVNVANGVAPVVNDTTAPSLAINNPVAGSVSGVVSVNVSATDNSGAAGIRQVLYIDGVQKAIGTGGALSYSWNTRKIATGIHTVKAVATDAAGNSSTVQVVVTK